MTKPDQGPELCRWTPNGYRLPTHQPTCTDRLCAGCTPCTHDEDGNLTRHCEIRHRCTSHLTWGEHACNICLVRIRRDLERLLVAMAYMPTEAEQTGGINSEAAYLAGPVANRILASWRLINADRAGLDVEELDESDPYTALSLRERMIREDLGHDETMLVSERLGGTITYLAWVLTDLARRDDQVPVLADLATTAATARAHAETVLHDSRTPERGAPCPACSEPAPRLVRKYAHWCVSPDCKRDHDLTGARDTWQCPTDRSHWWSEADYRLWVGGDYLAYADRLTASDMYAEHGVKPGTLRAWASKGLVRRRGRNSHGRQLYDVDDALAQHKVGAHDVRSA